MNKTQITKRALVSLFAFMLIGLSSALAQSTVDTMRELSQTAASFRALADYLERHPEAILRGKQEDTK